MIAIVNNNAVVINNSTSRRANVIAQRTGSDIMGVVKAQMIGNKVGNISTAKYPFFTLFALFAPLLYCKNLYR